MITSKDSRPNKLTLGILAAMGVITLVSASPATAQDSVPHWMRTPQGYDRGDGDDAEASGEIEIAPEEGPDKTSRLNYGKGGRTGPDRYTAPWIRPYKSQGAGLVDQVNGVADSLFGDGVLPRPGSRLGDGAVGAAEAGATVGSADIPWLTPVRIGDTSPGTAEAAPAPTSRGSTAPNTPEYQFLAPPPAPRRSTGQDAQEYSFLTPTSR